MQVARPATTRHSVGVTGLLYMVGAILLFCDATGGPLRFYTGAIGIEVLVYAPKALALGAVILTLTFIPQPRIAWFALAVILLSGPIALSNRVSPAGMAFAIFQISPFLLGIVTSLPESTRAHSLISGIIVIWLVTVLGVWIDVFVDFPWKGTGLEFLGTSVESSRSWTVLGIDRPAGFARGSAAAAFFAGTLGVLLFSVFRKTWLRIAIIITTFATIVATTNKAAAGGILVVLAFVAVRPVLLARQILLASVVVVTICLPLITSLYEFRLDPQAKLETLLIASFDDRLTTTWPHFLRSIDTLLVGQGLGGIGTPFKQFSANSTVNMLSVADNAALYLIGWFGILGGVFIFSWIGLKCYGLAVGEYWHKAIGLAGVFTIACAFTTDMFEGPISLFILGLLVRAQSPLKLDRNKYR